MPTKVKFTLLASEWGSKHGGLSTLNRVFAIELAKHSKVHVSVFVPRCDQEEIDEARNNKITLVQAARRPGFDEKDWLCFPPDNLEIDIVIGHGVILGRQAQIIRENRGCKWIQFVHTDPEELGMFKRYSDPIAKGETKHGMEVELCVMADFVVTVGPKLAEAYRSYLRSSKKDQKVFVLTPGIFSEFSGVEQATQEGNRCGVLAFGRGDSEDFSLKGFDIAAKAVGKLKNANLIFVGACNKQQDDVADNLKQCDIPPARLKVRTFLQSRQQLKDLFCEVDLVIMPSRTEGFGLAALEALSAGLPILASGNSGFGKALSKVSFGPGYVIHSDDPMVWAEEIEKVWAKDRETRLNESDTLRTLYAKKYNWKTQCNDLVEIARNIVTGPDESKPHLKRKASSCFTQDPKDQDKDEPSPQLGKLSSESGTQDPGHATPVCAESAGTESCQLLTDMTSNMDPPETDGPRLLTNKDLPNTSEPWEDVQLPIDILLLTVKDCEFLSCLSYLNGLFRSYHLKLGLVYIGIIGNKRMKLKIAVIKCDKGSSGPQGSTVVVKNAVDMLGPKAVFCVGFCGGLNSKKIKLGDVVVSAKLTTYAAIKILEDGIVDCGVSVPVPERILKLIKGIADGWVAPLKDPGKLEVNVHRDGVFLSGPELVDNKERNKELKGRFREAVAIEMEGEGLYAAAHDSEVPWVIIKGVSDFADGEKTKTSSWRPFASFMASSVAANILNDAIVFRDWSHYGSEYGGTNKRPIASDGPALRTRRRSSTQDPHPKVATGVRADASAAYAEPDRKRTKLTAEPTDGPAQRTRRHSSTHDPRPKVTTRVREGVLTEDELEELSQRLGISWEKLGRRLEFHEADITGFHKNNEEYDKKAMSMLFEWEKNNGSGATYEVLHTALCHKLVKRRDLAEEFCQVTR